MPRPRKDARARAQKLADDEAAAGRLIAQAQEGGRQ